MRMSLRIWLIVIGVLAALGLALWLSSAPPTELESEEEPQPAPERPIEKNLSELLCPGTEEAPKPQPRRPTLKVVAACVKAQGRVMFTSVLPNGDYLIKIWPTARYAALREACRPRAAEELSVDRYLAATIAKEDWPKFSAILQPGGPGSPYALAIPVMLQGVYVFSTEVNRHIYGPHCEIHPLDSLEPLKEEKE